MPHGRHAHLVRRVPSAGQAVQVASAGRLGALVSDEHEWQHAGPRRGVEILTATNGAKPEAAPATSPAP